MPYAASVSIPSEVKVKSLVVPVVPHVALLLTMSPDISRFPLSIFITKISSPLPGFPGTSPARYYSLAPDEVMDKDIPFALWMASRQSYG
jgi:hypothetical protein